MAVTKKKSAELGKAVGGASPGGPAVAVETDTSSDGPVSESSLPFDVEKKKPKSLRFYSIIIAIVCCSLLTALEGSIIPTALPSIVAELGGGEVFIWASNGYYVAMLVTRDTISFSSPARKFFTVLTASFAMQDRIPTATGPTG